MLEDRDRLIGLHLQALAVLDYKPPTTGDADDVIALIIAGELLTLDQADDVAECSDETIRRACELSAATSNPIGVKLAGRWLVGKARLLDDIEAGRLGRREPDARQRAEARAAKYAGWAGPQQPLNVAEGSRAVS
jgi:hypothetical protein